jgi:hypothetical protein
MLHWKFIVTIFINNFVCKYDTYYGNDDRLLFFFTKTKGTVFKNYFNKSKKKNLKKI